MKHPERLAAALVKSGSDESGTIEVTQFNGQWSFRQHGQLSKDYESLDDAIDAIIEGELAPLRESACI